MDQLAPDLRTMVRTPLEDAHVAAMWKVGYERAVKAGDVVHKAGDPTTEFTYLLDGEMEAVDPATGGRYGDGATLGPTQFTGDIAFLQGGSYAMSLRAVQDTTLLCVERQTMLDLMARIPEMSDIIITVLAARRRGMLERGAPALTLIGAEQGRTIRQIAAFAGRNRIPVRSLSLDEAEAEAVAHACAIAPRAPAVIFGKDEVIHDPTPRKIAQKMGMDLSFDADEIHDVMIVGGGPAGVAAAVYAGAEGLSALVVEDLSLIHISEPTRPY